MQSFTFKNPYPSQIFPKNASRFWKNIHPWSYVSCTYVTRLKQSTWNLLYWNQVPLFLFQWSLKLNYNNKARLQATFWQSAVWLKQMTGIQREELSARFHLFVCIDLLLLLWKREGGREGGRGEERGRATWHSKWIGSAFILEANVINT